MPELLHFLLLGLGGEVSPDVVEERGKAGARAPQEVMRDGLLELPTAVVQVQRQARGFEVRRMGQRTLPTLVRGVHGECQGKQKHVHPQALGEGGVNAALVADDDGAAAEHAPEELPPAEQPEQALPEVFGAAPPAQPVAAQALVPLRRADHAVHIVVAVDDGEVGERRGRQEPLRGDLLLHVLLHGGDGGGAAQTDKTSGHCDARHHAWGVPGGSSDAVRGGPEMYSGWVGGWGGISCQVKFAVVNFAAGTPRNVVVCRAVQAQWSLAAGANLSSDYPRFCVGNLTANSKGQISHTKLAAPEIPPPPCVTFRLVVVSLRGPGQSPVLPFACCVGALLSVGRCGRCSCWCRSRVRGAQWLVCWGCAGCGRMCRLRVSSAQ